MYTLKKIYGKVRNIYHNLLFPYTPSNNKYKIIFIHIPKTAGTSVRIALGESQSGRRHLPWWVYQQASPKKFEEYFKFCFVRDPITRTISGYNYLKSGGNKMDDLLISQHIKKYDSFELFVEEELLKGTMIYHPIFRPQTWYLCDWKGTIQVDYLGHFESLGEDFCEISKIIGLNAATALPIINKSNKRVDEIDEEIKKMICEVYKDDCSLLGYSSLL